LGAIADRSKTSVIDAARVARSRCRRVAAGGETNQYAPAIYRDTVPVEPDRTADEGYHFTLDMTDQTIQWVRQQKSLMSEKPFFMYFAPGATHDPHHVPEEWSARYRGRFDHGWERVRDETFARQQEPGVIPTNAELTARPDEIPAWDDMDDTLKPVLARQMEVYAGFLEHTDHQILLSLPATTRSGWSSPTTAADWGRVARPPFPRRHPGRTRPGQRHPADAFRPRTKPPTSGMTPALR
jgi:arylsulfatase A-like enzyme